jgi:hypothetical protein
MCFLHGRGIYSTPEVDVAALYAKHFKIEGRKYEVILQNRVNPESLQIVDKKTTGVGEYWVSSDDQHVRPYGICIRSKRN